MIFLIINTQGTLAYHGNNNNNGSNNNCDYQRAAGRMSSEKLRNEKLEMRKKEQNVYVLSAISVQQQ